MKKLFLLLLSVTIFSCSGELYENEIVIKDGLAYKKDSSSLYSGVLIDKYGEILGSYKKGTKDGEWIEVDAKNGTQKKANYISGTPDGEQVTYVFPGARENNKRLEYINYENGNPVGIWTQWGRDGENRIRKSGEIIFENGSGRWREWDLNTRAVTRAGDYENWKKVNIWKSWDSNEVLVSEGEYVDGKKEGKWTWYDKGEDKNWEENYVAGTLEGKFYNLSPYAEIRGKGKYNMGTQTGNWEEYYTSADGSLERKQSGSYELFGVGSYLDGKKNGEWNYVAPRNNPIVKGFFEGGNPSGDWEVQYNKKNYKGAFQDLKKKVPKLNEYKF